MPLVAAMEVAEKEVVKVVVMAEVEMEGARVAEKVAEVMVVVTGVEVKVVEMVVEVKVAVRVVEVKVEEMACETRGGGGAHR